MTTQYQIRSTAGLYKSGLYGWVRDASKAGTLDFKSLMLNLRNYHPDQLLTLEVVPVTGDDLIDPEPIPASVFIKRG